MAVNFLVNKSLPRVWRNKETKEKYYRGLGNNETSVYQFSSGVDVGGGVRG